MLGFPVMAWSRTKSRRLPAQEFSRRTGLAANAERTEVLVNPACR